MRELTRRDMLKVSGVGAVGIAGAMGLAGCSTTTPAESSAESTAPAESMVESIATAAGMTSAEAMKQIDVMENIPDFLIPPTPIAQEDIISTEDYDVVIIGAGAAGVPCALRANELGLKVAVLQKESIAVSQGNSGSGIKLETSDPAGVAAIASMVTKGNAYRSSRELTDMWAYNSGEAVSWVVAQGEAAGAQVVDEGNKQQVATVETNGYKIDYVTSFFGPKPYTTGDGMIALAGLAEENGVTFYYQTPAVELVKDGEKVVGVIGEGKDGFVQLNGTKAVILATGDYQNNENMVHFYQPDLINFERKQYHKTGDGHRMGVWAGGVLENLAHTKMLHDFDAGPATMCDMPFLSVKDDGTRFCDETAAMSIRSNFLRSEVDAGWYSQIFDADYMKQAAEWPGHLIDPEGLENYMPESDMEHTGVFTDLIRTFKADTLEELAEKLEIKDVDTFLATVARNNELYEKGQDEDFGKSISSMNPVLNPPFYGIHRHVRCSAICSGLNVNGELQVVNSDDQPIEGLYAIGNVSGNFYGGIDYPLDIFGLSLGRCYTQGYVLATNLAK